MTPSTPVPHDETARLDALRRLAVLDTPPEERFDRLVRLACAVMDVPIAMVNLVDEHRQWSKASYGVGNGHSPREQSFCAFTLVSREPVIVGDTLTDERFRDNAQVLGQPYLRFYAGIPLFEPGGHVVGALCIADQVPRNLHQDQLGPLRDLASIAENELARVDVVAATQARNAADARSAAIVAATGDALLTLDGRGVILDANPATQRMFGYAAAELIGAPCSVLEAEANHGGISSGFERVIASRPEPVVMEPVLRRRDGTTFPSHITTTTFTDGGQQLFVVSVSDDTGHHQAEVRTAAALVAQQAANAELDRVNHLKSEFTSMVSHEFRTALTGVKAFSELIRDRDLPIEQIKEFAGDINADTERLTRMITDLLDLDRMEAGQIVLHPAALDLDGVVTEVTDRFTHNDSGHRIDVRAGGVPIVPADHDTVVQALSNLLANAIKFSPEQSTVTVTTFLDSDWVRVSVGDQGGGIAADQLERIFDRYAKVENGATRQFGGTGLGLPLVRQIMHLHGGHAWAESPPGEGARFHLALPRTGPPGAPHQ